MKISAILHPQSAQARDWRVRTRPSGRISGIMFHRRGDQFVTDALTAEEIETLKKNPFVKLEAIGEATAPQKTKPAAPPRKPSLVKSALDGAAKLIGDDELFGGKGT